MRRIEIRPSWIFIDEEGNQLEPQLFALLDALHETGKLTLAAARAKMSYRHAWNIVAKWSSFFGSPLVLLEQGRGTHLTALGEKLLWAQARARARLSPQLENIASELNLEIKRVLAQSNPTLRVHASYGYAVAELPDLLREHGKVGLDLQYLPAADALASLARSACDFAGFHVPEGVFGARAVELYAPWLDPSTQALIYLVRRQQGLYLAPGNPKKISALRDVGRKGVRFVNRQRGSGTRLLFDALIEELGIDKSMIEGYANEEFTHAAVAAYVASGMADVGVGVEPPAREFKLDFIPVAAERYFFICHRETLEIPGVSELLRLLQGPEFKRRVAQLPGYTADRSGEIMEFTDAFPWLRAPTSRAPRTPPKTRKAAKL
ncbi:MAG: substrate-binding domain-containing protein [Betaproteobacteria bacterium]